MASKAKRTPDQIVADMKADLDRRQRRLARARDARVAFLDGLASMMRQVIDEAHGETYDLSAERSEKVEHAWEAITARADELAAKAISG